LTVGQAGTLLGVSTQTLDGEARGVVALARAGVERPLSAQADRAPVAWRVHDDHDTAVALELPMVEALVVEHEMVVCGLNFFTAPEVAPGHVAIVGRGTSGAWPFRSLGERAQRGSGSPRATLMAPYGADTTKAVLCAVIAIGDHVGQGGPMVR
jgi:hypothetical protein